MLVARYWILVARFCSVSGIQYHETTRAVNHEKNLLSINDIKRIFKVNCDYSRSQAEGV